MSLIRKYWFIIPIILLIVAVSVFYTVSSVSESDVYYSNDWQPSGQQTNSAGWRGKIEIEYADGTTENLKLLQVGKSFHLFDILFPGQSKPVTGIRYVLDVAVQSSEPNTQVVLDFKDFYLQFATKAVSSSSSREDTYVVDYKYNTYDYQIVNCYVGDNKEWHTVIDSRIPVTFFLKNEYVSNPCLLSIQLKPSGSIRYRTIYNNQYGEWHNVPNLPVSVNFNLESKVNIYQEPQINIYFRSGAPSE